MPRRLSLLTAIAAVGLLAGCDMLGIESPEKLAAAREADGKAVGAACRHAGRAIEDCYALNRKSDKASMFAGWREMNDYMRDNKMEAVAPQFTPAQPAVVAKADAAVAAPEETKQPGAKVPAARPKGDKPHDS